MGAAAAPAPRPGRRAGTGTGPTRTLGDAVPGHRRTAYQVRVPMPGLLTARPDAGPRRRRRGSRGRRPRPRTWPIPGAPGGSYFGLKETGPAGGASPRSRRAPGTTPARQQALDRLRPQLVDWLTYAGPADGRVLRLRRAAGAGSSPSPPSSAARTTTTTTSSTATWYARRPCWPRPTRRSPRDYGADGRPDGPGLRGHRRRPTATAGCRRSGCSTPTRAARRRPGSCRSPTATTRSRPARRCAAWEAVVRWGLVSGEQRRAGRRTG